MIRLEKAHFPGLRADKYAFENDDLAKKILGASDDRDRWITSVAESNEGLVGFARSAPFTLPGTGQTDPNAMLLNQLAVDEGARGNHVAARLIDQVVARTRARNQCLMIAHASTISRPFYNAIRWRTFDSATGFAWQPKHSHMSADIADDAIGYPHIAVKTIKPQMLAFQFSFPVASGRPNADALLELAQRIESGAIRQDQLHSGTIHMARELARHGPLPGMQSFHR